MVEQITYTTEQIMAQAQVFASAWSLAGGPFDAGDGLALAEQEKAELAAMVSSMTARLEQLEASNSLLASTDMEKTLDIVTIGEALGIPGEEQEGGITEFLEAIEQLRQFERICAGLSQDCIDGGYNVAEHRLHCKRVEDERDLLRSRVADLLHLLQHARITTPSQGDAKQAHHAITDLARMVTANPATSVVAEQEPASREASANITDVELPSGLSWSDAPQWATVLVRDASWQPSLIWAEGFFDGAIAHLIGVRRPRGAIHFGKGHQLTLIATRSVVNTADLPGERDMLYGFQHATEQQESARYRHLRDHCTREWDIHDYEEVLVRIPCGPGIQHCDDLDAIVDASIAAKEAADA